MFSHRLFQREKKNERICSICQFPWCKYSCHSWWIWGYPRAVSWHKKKSMRVQTVSSTPGQRGPKSNPKDNQEENSGPRAGWGQDSEACVLEDTWPLLVWALIWGSLNLCVSTPDFPICHPPTDLFGPLSQATQGPVSWRSSGKVRQGAPASTVNPLRPPP